MFEIALMTQTATNIPLRFLRIAALMTISIHAFAQLSDTVIVETISVVDDIGQGVESEIRMLDRSDLESHFVYTDKRGVAEPKLKCSKQHRLIAKPKVDIYKKITEPPYCAKQVKFDLKMTRISISLIVLGNRALDAKNFGLASMLYTEAAWRAAEVDPATAAKAEMLAYEALGAKLGNLKIVTFDRAQARHVLSAEGVKALRAFQIRNKLRPTGALDFPTQRTLAGEAIFPYIRQAYRTTEMIVDAPRAPSP